MVEYYLSINYISITFQAKEAAGVKIFRFEGPLLYLSFDYFKRTLISKTGFDPSGLAKYGAGERRALKPSTPPNPPLVAQRHQQSQPPIKRSESECAGLREHTNGTASNLTVDIPNPNCGSSETRTQVDEPVARASTSSNEDDSQNFQSLSSRVVPRAVPQTMHNGTVPIQYSDNTGSIQEVQNISLATRGSHIFTSKDRCNGVTNVAFHKEREQKMESSFRPLDQIKPRANSHIVNESHVSMESRGNGKSQCASATIDMGSIGPGENEEVNVQQRQLVLDCSSWSGIDFSALEQLVVVHTVLYSVQYIPTSIWMYCVYEVCTYK